MSWQESVVIGFAVIGALSVTLMLFGCLLFWLATRSMDVDDER